MSSDPTIEYTTDNTDILNDALEKAWIVLSDVFDENKASCLPRLPDLLTLLEGIDLSTPERAAERVLSNMLLEIIENTSRFSPWYRMPARAFGLVSIRDTVSGCNRWILAPEAVQRWQPIIQPLAKAIWKNTGLIQAVLLVESLLQDAPENDPCVEARCACFPPRTIRVKKSVLERASIFCDKCLCAFCSAA